MNIFEVLGSVNHNAYGAITLGQLIDTLAAADQSAVVFDGFGEPDSWRGVYAYLAFSPLENATVSDMLKHARSAVGATFGGWKGGEFTMTRETPCFIAECGRSDGETDPITPERLKKMLGVEVAEKRASSLPERPHIVEIHGSHHGTWCVTIPDETWEAFKAYVCKLEALVAKAQENS